VARLFFAALTIKICAGREDFQGHEKDQGAYTRRSPVAFFRGVGVFRDSKLLG
jgi:hypothetical protein